MVDPSSYFKLGYKIVHVFLRKNPHLYYLKEDLEQEATLSVILSANKFEDRGKIRFSTYCGKEVYNAILKYLINNENKFRNLCPKSVEDLLSPESEEDKGTWEDLIPGEIVDIEATLSRLPLDVQEFVYMFNKGKTTREIREELGCSWEQIESYKESLYQALKK